MLYVCKLIPAGVAESVFMRLIL